MRTNTTLKTKAMSILLAIVMLLGMLPMSVFAADEGSTGGVEIATSELPTATVGVAYSVTLSATPEGSTFFWNITGLPDGLTADYSGNITGTPEAAGSYTVSVSVGSTGGGSASKNFTLTVNATHTHVWSDDWSSSKNYHWHDCTAEGCNLNPTTGTNKDGYATHEFEIIRDTHSYIDPIGFGFHYGTCVECGRSGSQIIIEATCQFNDTHHWYECPCGVIGWDEFRDKAEHSFDDDADMICDGCGYDRTPKSPASVTKAPEAITGLKFKEENGIEVQQILVTAGEAAGGTMVYRIDDGEWGTTIPARGQVRDYTVYYKVRGDSDHNDSAEGSVRVSIAKADAPTVTIPTQQHIYTTATTGNSINIKSLLPNLCAIIDDQSGVTETTGDFIKNAVLNNGVLTYDTDAVNAPTTGTIKVKIVMRNYEDVTVTVNVELISAPHVHNFGTDWKSDGTNHWHECSCDAKADEAAHNGGTATCKDKAVCSVCGTAYGNLAEHTYGSATCEEPATCSECGATTGDTLGHKDDNSDHTCDRGCGKTDMGIHGDSNLDHACDYGCAVAIGTHAAATGKHTCDYCGNAVTTCTDFADVVKPEALKSAADCTNPAVYYKSCTVCGANGTETFTSGEALSHTYDEGVVTTKPGCETEGIKTFTCTCGHSYTEPVSATGHTYTTEITAPTCTEKGYTTYTCACGDSYVGDEVAATGHSFTEYKANGDATCTADGTKTAKCDNCEETDTAADTGSKKVHTYENGKCTVCQAVDPNYIPEASSPQTGDNSNMALWIALLLLSGGAVITLTVYDRKRRNTVKH